MKQNIQIFNNPKGGYIRTLLINSEPWFIGKDIATALGYDNSRDAIKVHVNKEDKGVAKCDTLLMNLYNLMCKIAQRMSVRLTPFVQNHTHDVDQIDTIDNLGRKQQLTFVTESGMYDVIQLPPIE